jgi:hypothetical protein
VRPLHSGDANVNQDEGARPATTPRRGAISPRLSLLLVGGVAMGGLVCMCLAVVVLAVWKGT